MNRFSRMPHWCRIGACALLLAGCVATSAAAPPGEILWPRKAAEQGLAAAQFNLGNGYYNGQGVPQDSVSAYGWLNLAASRATPEFRDALVGERDRFSARLTPAQLAKAQQWVRQWKPKSAGDGVP